MMMIIKNFLTAALLCLTTTPAVTAQNLGGVLQESSAETPPTRMYSCSYTTTDPLYLDGWGDGDMYLQHFSNYEEGTMTIRLRYEGPPGWVAIGINMDGDHHMTNSVAVIGSVQNGVKMYWMTSEERDASGVWELDDIHSQLRDTKFEQDLEAEITTLEFTWNLDIADEDEAATIYHTINEDSAWIWAAGLPGNQWQGIHRTLGFFSGLVPEDGCELVEMPEAPQTMVPTEDGSSSTTETNVFDEGEGIEYSDADGEENLESGMGSDGSNETSSSASASAANSGINFGSSGSAGAGSEATRGLWVTHGILLGVAWGIFAPLAIGAAYLKKMSYLQNNALWLSIHKYGTIAVVVFTVLGFILGVVATSKEGSTHFNKTTHNKAGLAIFILILLQGMMGFWRPSPNPPLEKDTAKNVDDDDTDSENKDQPSSLNDTMEHADSQGSLEISVDGSSDEAKLERPRWIRQCWEYFHRFLGICLLGLAWYNCSSGIVLQSEKYAQDDQEQLTAIFWSITGLIAGTIFMVGYVIRVE